MFFCTISHRDVAILMVGGTNDRSYSSWESLVCDKRVWMDGLWGVFCIALSISLSARCIILYHTKMGGETKLF